MIVDAQHGFLAGAAAIPAAGLILDHLTTLITAARAAGALIVYLQNNGAPGAPDEPGTAGWQIHPRIAPRADDVVLRKTQDDGFENTELAVALAGRGVTRIAVAGLLSEMCVSATVRGALARGLAVVLVHDAHGTYPVEDIPADSVARVAEHALGDEIELVNADAAAFNRPAR